jgi:hypothetical protein
MNDWPGWKLGLWSMGATMLILSPLLLIVGIALLAEGVFA